MKTFIAILRGINVSGKNLIRMTALREMCEFLGFREVQTYIQSGNVVFRSPAELPESLAGKISDAIRASFGFEVPVLVMTADYLDKVSCSNPFLLQRQEDVSRLHVTFFGAEPAESLWKTLETVSYPPDEFLPGPKAVYLFCPAGYGNTKLSNAFFERKLKVTATTRNWATVLELLKMAKASG